MKYSVLGPTINSRLTNFYSKQKLSKPNSNSLSLRVILIVIVIINLNYYFNNNLMSLLITY